MSNKIKKHLYNNFKNVNAVTKTNVKHSLGVFINELPS